MRLGYELVHRPDENDSRKSFRAELAKQSHGNPEKAYLEGCRCSGICSVCFRPGCILEVTKDEVCKLRVNYGKRLTPDRLLRKWHKLGQKWPHPDSHRFLLKTNDWQKKKFPEASHPTAPNSHHQQFKSIDHTALPRTTMASSKALVATGDKSVVAIDPDQVKNAPQPTRPHHSR